MRRRPPRHKLPDTLFPYATHFRSQMTAWDDWLRKLSADGKGGLGLRGQPQMRAIDRGLPYVYVMAIGMDVSADSFEASIRAAPDAAGAALADFDVTVRSEEHTSELQSLMRTSYAVFCLKKKT